MTTPAHKGIVRQRRAREPQPVTLAAAKLLKPKEEQPEGTAAPAPGRSPDIAYRVTDRAGNVLMLGCDKGDVVGVRLGRGGPLMPFRVVYVAAGKGQITLVPLGGKYDPEADKPEEQR